MNLKEFDMKKYIFSSVEVYEENNKKITKSQDSKIIVEKYENWGDKYFDLLISEYDFKLKSPDIAKEKYEAALFDMLFLRVDENMNLYELLNKKTVVKKLEIIKEISEDINYIDINFNFTEKMKKILNDEELMKITIMNHSFYQLFFSEIYNKFYKDISGKYTGEKYEMNILRKKLLPLELEIEKAGKNVFIIKGRLNTSQLSVYELVKIINNDFSQSIKNINLKYENIIEVDENYILKKSKKLMLLKGDNGFLIGKNMLIEEIK